MIVATLPSHLHGSVEPDAVDHLRHMNPDGYPNYLLYRTSEASVMAAAKRFQEPDPHGLVHRRYWKSMVDLYFLVSSTECGSHTVADKMCVEEAHYHMNSFQYLDLKDPYYRNHNGDYFASDSLHFHGSLELWGNANGCINWCRSSSSWTVSHVGGMRLRKGPPMPRAKVLKRIARIAEYGVGR